LILAIAILSALLISLAPGCSSPSLPMEAQLSFSAPPLLNKPVQITANFKLVADYPIAKNVKASIILPDGFEKVDGDLEWQGDINRDESHTLKATVRSIKVGNWKVEARATWFPDENSKLGGSSSLYVTVSENDASISDRPPISTGISTATPGSTLPSLSPPASTRPMETMPPVQTLKPEQIPAPTTSAPGPEALQLSIVFGAT
jgi:hypothetical protein